MITIDGSFGEGGGQILRSSLSLSAITQQPITLHNIRANRKKPGLRRQHLACVQALAQLCEAEVSGDEVGSDHVTFAPTTLPQSNFTYDIGTAGSTSLLFHALYYPMLWGQQGGTLELLGGTHNAMAPSFDYLERVWQPLLSEFGFEASLELGSYGFYPKGGGHIRAFIPPKHPVGSQEAQGEQDPSSLTWTERPAFAHLEIVAMFAQPQGQRPRKQIPQRMATMAQKILKAKGFASTVTTLNVESASAGAVCSIFATFGNLRAGFVAFGDRGVSSEAVGKQVALEALQFLESEACVDSHAADQLLLPLALRGKPASFTTSEKTGHLETNADIIQRFLPNCQFVLTEQAPNLVLVELKTES
ncbi:MAG: RNA 3'-phosphate cyclase [Deltaproteobacteria bacterium]|nr:MAG: RNA 3'-phosphate cyclase [Deltaproteobacteria bacterium]